MLESGLPVCPQADVPWLGCFVPSDGRYDSENTNLDWLFVEQAQQMISAPVISRSVIVRGQRASVIARAAPTDRRAVLAGLSGIAILAAQPALALIPDDDDEELVAKVCGYR